MAEPITVLLDRWHRGDRSAMDELMPLVYEELRKLGRSYLRRRPPQSILEPTLLVHELWMKMSGKQHLALQTRAHFYALSAKIMREVLVDHVRRQRSAKRGRNQILTDLDGAHAPNILPQTLDLLVLEEALLRLGEISPRYVRIVELRFFGGLTIAESAQALDVSHATLEREWNFARSWLRRELSVQPSKR